MWLIPLFSTAAAADSFWSAGGLLDAQGGLQVEAADVGDSTATYAAALGNFSRFNTTSEPLDTLGLHVLAGTSVLGLFRLDADLEMSPWQSSGDSAFVLGDLLLGATVPFLRKDAVPWKLGVDIGAGLPVGAPETFSTGGVRAQAALLAGYRSPRFFLDLQGGAQVLPQGALVPLGGVGVGVGVHRLLRLGLELDGALPDGGLAPLDLHGYAAFGDGNGFAATLGAGGALIDGEGAAGLRILAMVGYRYPGVELLEDRDGDGLDDEIDACPGDPEDRDGALDADGCPDLDNDSDGIADATDACRNQAEDADGFDDTDGCPDLDDDADGVRDANDLCPAAPGPALLRGCPDPDNDGLTVPEDRCPQQKGPRSTGGCPDRDSDGVTDDRDACPDIPKDPLEDPATSDGCRRRVVVTADRIKFDDPIFFATNAATILPESAPLLAEIGTILKKNPQVLSVEIGGHTDADGSEAYNLDLSAQRAEAVRVWLIEKEGVAPGRLTAKGYGETRPVDSNETDAGKAKNRRVELVIVKKDTPGQP